MTKKVDLNKMINALNKAKNEEEVKGAYTKHFDISYDTSDRHDLYTPQILFEFKYDKNFQNLKQRAAVLAQNLYYVHRLKYGITDKGIPYHLCLADKNESILTETNIWKEFYSENEGRYDWDLAPSNPDSILIDDLLKSDLLKHLHIYRVNDIQELETYDTRLRQILDPQLSINFGDKKIITEDNFEDVFLYWNKIFGESVRNGLKSSRYFVCDIQEGRTYLLKDQGKVFFDFGSGDGRAKKILSKDYEYFWSIYDKVTNPDIIRSILAKIDRLTDESMRRFHGEFFTPINFAKKGLEYIEKTIGNDWWKSGEYRLWDMASGTGNLEYYLPTEALKYCYLSTLYKEEVEHCERLFPEATIFQYDYLNDDIANVFSESKMGLEFTWKLPNKILIDLNNPGIKWIILINPPFATSQTAGTSGKSKKDVSDSDVRLIMHKNKLGEVSRELFSQFLFRIKREFKDKTTHLGLFSTLKYINANNDQKFRDDVFDFVFERGLMFSSANFSGTKKSNAFPIGFLVWNLSLSLKIEKQKIELDVFNQKVEKISKKEIIVEHRDKFLSKWINRETADLVFPPLGSAISVKHNNLDSRDRIAKDFILSLMCKGNDFQNQNFTALLSGPYVSAGALSVTPDNFEKAMIIHAVRRMPKANWINDRDQFMQPNSYPLLEFIIDCVIWNLFSSSNQTAAMSNVKYLDKLYQIHNHFFPFKKTVVKKWKITDGDISMTLTSGEDRFLANWLEGKTLSKESQILLDLGKEIYKQYFENLNQINTNKFKITTWDAGWWQIRNALAEQNFCLELLTQLKEKHTELKKKLLPQITAYGFINSTEINE